MSETANWRCYKRPESVLVVIYTTAMQVLLLRRRQPENFWQSVTGSLEWNERPAQAALRELGEETGFAGEGLDDCHQVHRFAIYPAFRHLYAPGITQNLECVFRVCLPHPVPPVLDNQEHVEYRWLSKAKALALVSSYTNRDAIRQWVVESQHDCGTDHA